MTEQLTLAPTLSSGSAPAGRRPMITRRSRLAMAGSAGVVTMLAWSAALAQPAGGGGTTALTGVQAGEGPTAMLQAICTFILGGFGQTLAVLGIVGIGLAWMFGRVSLGLIAGVIGGIIIMFGASYLAETLTGGSTG